MKCPNCGSELIEGHLYCDECHEEICFVPNFDPELENSIVETLSNVAEEVMPTKELNELDNTTEEFQVIRNKRSKIIYLIIGTTIIFIFCWSFFLYSKTAYYINGRAEASFHNGNYEKSKDYYNRIIDLKGESLDVYLQLAQCYTKLNDIENIEAVYLNILRLDSNNEEAYDQMIDIYKKQEAYDEIYALLSNCEDAKILEEYRQYLANVPDFSVAEGTYSTIISLKLRSDTSGTIYYTLDGSIPDETSDMYTVPIFLESGTHVVQAMFVNDYGMKSELKSRTYTIEVQQPYAPEVNLYSGDYSEASYIIVEAQQNCVIYYTTDGTDPTRNSMIYTEPILMPVGKSEFRFMNYSEVGGSGKITVRNYNLILPESEEID
ncbi:MAG: chitobiase/beta-hexosaminidase C-terminal domain-containing protein [Eubacteriales bacterium]